MPEYLRALHERFTTASPEAAKIQCERDRILARLRGRLDRSQRVLLLHLLDLEDDLRDQTSLDSFLSGVRLARGRTRNRPDKNPQQGGDPPCRKSY